MDLTVTTADLAAVAADAVRLVPGKLLDPVLAGLLLEAGPRGVVAAATDRDRAARLECPALVHTEGRVLVPAKPFAETLRALELPQVRLVVEGSRLAIRAPGARFALPLLDADSHPGVAALPRVVGSVDASVLTSALGVVAATASRDDALPMFTGVRMRAEGDRLVVLASDRYRLAVASLPWEPTGEPFDAMIPATLLLEVARQAPDGSTVTVHADADRVGLAWHHAVVTTSLLDAGFLHESKVSVSDVDTIVEVDADAMAGAVRRVSLYADTRGTLRLEVGDGEVCLRGADQQAGEAEESVKAEVSGGRTSPTFQSRFLVDALKSFAGRRVRIELQPGLRATIFRAADEDPTDLRYLVVPIMPRT
jgi:DNA polymerase-3 subunit beta